MFNEPCPEFHQPTSPVAASTDHNFGSVVLRQCSDDGNHFLANVSFPPLHHRAQQHHHVMPMEQHEESAGSHHDFSSPKSTTTVSNDDDMPLPPFVVCRVDDDQSSDNLGNLVDIRSPHSNSIGSGDSCGFFLSSLIDDGSGDAAGSKANAYTMPVSSSLFECPSSPAQQQYNATSMSYNSTFSPKATSTVAASTNGNTAVAASGGVISGLSSNAFTANIAMNEVFCDDMFPDPGLVTFVEMRVSGHPSP